MYVPIGFTFVPVRNVLGDCTTKDPVDAQSVWRPALDLFPLFSSLDALSFVAYLTA